MLQKPGQALDRARGQAATIGPRRRARGRRFTLDGRPYRYLVHPYNTTWRNERTVEIPLALEALEEHRGRPTLEVGHVTHWYVRGRIEHEVVDKYEAARGVRNIDVLDVEPGPRYDLVLAISTIEHVGFDEEVKDPAKPRAAVAHLHTLLKPGGELLVTIPIGQNPAADDLFFGEPAFDRMSFLKRRSEEHDWVQAGADEVRGARYGSPFFAANAVAIGRSRR